MANENDSQRRGNSGGAASTVQSVADAGHAAVDKFQEYSSQAAESYEHSRERVNQWLDDVRQRATDEPLKTVLMATGVGIVLGVLFG
jgi:ElaB/YqjD/DUF883 family membrane-anchored ribosome-binding protein